MATPEAGLGQSFGQPPPPHRRILRFLRVLPFGEAEVRAAARIRARLEGEGKPIGPLDVLVATTALEQQAVLVTHTTREFRRMTGLRVEDWY